MVRPTPPPTPGPRTPAPSSPNPPPNLHESGQTPSTSSSLRRRRIASAVRARQGGHPVHARSWHFLRKRLQLSCQLVGSLVRFVLPAEEGTRAPLKEKGFAIPRITWDRSATRSIRSGASDRSAPRGIRFEIRTSLAHGIFDYKARQTTTSSPTQYLAIAPNHPPTPPARAVGGLPDIAVVNPPRRGIDELADGKSRLAGVPRSQSSARSRGSRGRHTTSSALTSG